MSEDAKVTPALTPEEWGSLLIDEEVSYHQDAPPDSEHGQWFGISEHTGKLWFGVAYLGDDNGRDEVRNRHGLAALALHGQPFGFTREDATNLRALPDVGWHYGGEGGVETVREWLNDLAGRIEALLPPSPSESPDAR